LTKSKKSSPFTGMKNTHKEYGENEMLEQIKIERRCLVKRNQIINYNLIASLKATIEG